MRNAVYSDQIGKVWGRGYATLVPCLIKHHRCMQSLPASGPLGAAWSRVMMHLDISTHSTAVRMYYRYMFECSTPQIRIYYY